MSFIKEVGSFVAGIGRQFTQDVTTEVVKPYRRAAGDEMGSTLRGVAVALRLDPHELIEMQRGIGQSRRQARKASFLPSGYMPR